MSDDWRLNFLPLSSWPEGYPDDEPLDHSDGPFHGIVAFDEAVRRQIRSVEFSLGAEWGAMWICAVILMAEAIRDRHRCLEHDECRELRSMGEACFAQRRMARK